MIYDDKRRDPNGKTSFMVRRKLVEAGLLFSRNRTTLTNTFI